MSHSNNDELVRLAEQLNEEGKYAEAYALVQPLLSLDIPEALRLAGTLLYIGAGVPADGVRAVELLSRAADLGDGLAAHNLGTLFGTGAQGVQRDAALSKHYYARAKQLGCDLWPDDDADSGDQTR